MTVGASGVWEQRGEGDYVVVVHGLGRTKLAMYPLCRALKKSGYHVINVGYPSLAHGVEELDKGFLRPAVERYCTNPTKRIHFVGHSMGNLLIRNSLRGRGLPLRLGKVVMLAPPNRGSDIIDKIGDWGLSRFIFGPAVDELGTGEGSVAQRLGPVDYPVAVIMGNKASIPLFRGILPGESDGIVSVDGGRVEGMEAFHVCDASHTFIMNNKSARRVLIDFLGRDSPSSSLSE